MDKARSTALKILCRITASEAYSNIELKNADLSGPDRAFCTELIKGVTERRRTLDYIIRLFVSRTPDPVINEILRMGVYQILYLDRVPDHAVCDWAVNEARACRRQSAGFVNAVLRSVCRERESISHRLSDAPEAVIYSVSDSIFKLIKAQYPGEYKDILQSFFVRRPLCIRANTLKDTPYSDGVYPGADMRDLEKGLFFVQGLSSQEAVRALDARPGMDVIDVCACPGGKSFGAAIDMNNTGSILACDLHRNKLPLIEKGAKKLGISIIGTAARDSRISDPSLVSRFDRVLCDVPCSGLGVIGTKPEIRYKDAGDFAGLKDTQSDILGASAGYLRVGGKMVYSTCTVNRAENSEIVKVFLKSAPGYVLNTEKQILPSGTHDGFYYAVITRKE